MQDTNCIIKCPTNWYFNLSKNLTIINLCSNLMNYTTRSLICLKICLTLRVFTFEIRILSNQSRMTVIDLISLTNLLWNNSHVTMQCNKQISTPERVYRIYIIKFSWIIHNKHNFAFNNFRITTVKTLTISNNKIRPTPKPIA